MYKQFEVIDHTADIGIIAYGRELGELMDNAACGMTSLMIDPGTIQTALSTKIELQEQDDVTLLVEWLNEIIYVLDAEGLIFREFAVAISAGLKLSAVCYGEKLDTARHKLKREIKAATYHNLYIVKLNNVYSANIIFDI